MMAKDIDDLCVNNNIEYYLIWGSAIGAVRHKGFIPWDDDFDIIMDYTNYQKFLRIAKKQLNPEKYCVEEGFIDWPMPYSKVILLGTVYEDPGVPYNPNVPNGIFVDVFVLENSPSNRFKQLLQYTYGTLLTTYCLKIRGYYTKELSKRLLMLLSFPLKMKSLRNYCQRQIERYRGINTDYVGIFSDRLYYRSSFFKKESFGKSLRVPFEDTSLPIPSDYDSVLRTVYGDYLSLPPEEQRVATHNSKIDFGNY